MFISFLYPYSIRGVEAPFLWVFYKQLSEFASDEIIFIGSKEYFKNPLEFINRWEFNEESLKQNVYEIPTIEKINSYKYIIIEDSIFEELNKNSENAMFAWKNLILNDYLPLEKVLEKEFTQIENIEAVLTWCNCKSLSNICDKFEIPLIHNELGALRGNEYIQTAYFDFQGVNGNTNSEDLYNDFKSIELNELLPLDSLVSLMKNNFILDNSQLNRYEVGIALQVEDDSNIIAYSNGYDSFKILNNAIFNHNKKDILIRKHPSGKFDYGDYFGVIDNSKNAIDFVSKCKKIETINSSVVLEALFQNKLLKVYGESPFKFLTDSIKNLESYKDAEFLKKINFLVIAYMIPYDLLFNIEYYRWRLKRLSQKDIFIKHKEYYLNLCGVSNEINNFEETFVTKKILLGKLNNKQKLLLKKENEILNFVNDKNYLEKELEKKDLELEKNKMIINDLQKDSEEKTAWAGNLAKELNESKYIINNLENELILMHTSKSWKITRPLRILKKKIKDFIKG